MRKILVSTLCFAALLPSAARATAPAADEACHPPGSHTLAEGNSGQIYAVGSAEEPPKEVYGCLYRTGKPRRLRLPTEANGFSILRFIGQLALQGKWAAYSWSAVQGVDSIHFGVVVENLITGKLSHVNPSLSGSLGGGFGPVRSIAVKHNGSVVWGAEIEGTPPHIQIESDGIEGFRVLDEGSEIDAASLVLSGSTAWWTDSATPQSATVR
jgi:hypothetical protein